MIIVSDTSPLNGLAIVGHLPLLQQIYGRVLVPPAVADELTRGGEDDPRITTVLSVDWIEVRQPTDRQGVESLRMERNLDRGEFVRCALRTLHYKDSTLLERLTKIDKISMRRINCKIHQ